MLLIICNANNSSNTDNTIVTMRAAQEVHCGGPLPAGAHSDAVGDLVLE